MELIFYRFLEDKKLNLSRVVNQINALKYLPNFKTRDMVSFRFAVKLRDRLY